MYNVSILVQTRRLTSAFLISYFGFFYTKAMREREEEEEGVKVISLSELIQRSRPLTGASSLHLSRPIAPFPPPPPSPPGPTIQNPNPNPKILKSLNYPTILAGTLSLPNLPDTSSPPNRPSCCPRTGCFSFSDGSSIVCCDVLEFDIRIIDVRIHVIAWNFVSFKSGGGFLEIIKWVFPRFNLGASPDLGVVPLRSGSECDVGARFRVLGVVESVSPVSAVPCSTRPNSSGSKTWGFLVRVLICDCRLCNSKENSMVLFVGGDEGQIGHCFSTPVIVYFLGFASSWHPVITKLVGDVVFLSGTQRKMVFIGKEQSQLMYVTTEKTCLSLLPKLVRERVRFSKSVIEGKGECGSYTGTITGVYMKGVVVELDHKALLLVTDQALVLPHSVRVGAILSIRNVHFVNPNFSWTKIHVLGACFKTSFFLESFSPFETGCCAYLQSQSLLERFIDSLVFSARLWVLLLVSSFKQKFAGVFSETDILGTKHRKGLVHLFAFSHLLPSMFQSRQGVFREYCNHDSCGCGKEPNCGELKLVVPISNFINHCDATWMKMLLKRDADSELLYDCSQRSSFFCKGLYQNQTYSYILQSDGVGVTLLGWTKISLSSGRLEFIDSTGSIDVLIPDIQSTWSINSIYEVNNFSLVIEGIPEHMNHLGVPSPDESFSCRNIFSVVPCTRMVNVAMYLFYYFRDTEVLDHPLYPTVKNNGSFAELESRRFHMLMVTHKYPFKQKFQGESGIAYKSSVYAEAFLLPWDLYFFGKDDQKETTGDYTSRNCKDFVPSKRFKTGQASFEDLSSKSRCGGHQLGFLNSCSTTSTSLYEGERCAGVSSQQKIPCRVTFRENCNLLLHSSATECCSKPNAKISSSRKQKAQKVLLEFDSESFCKYELLKINEYYIVRHHKGDACPFDSIDHVNFRKVTISSKTQLWSFSFISSQVFLNTDIFDPSRSADLTNEVSASRLNCEFPCESEVTIHLSNEDLDFLKDNLKGLDESLIKPLISLKEVINIFSCNGRTGLELSSGNFDSDYQLPEGNLISLHGQVLAIHDCGFCEKTNFRSSTGVQRENMFHLPQSVCIHVLMDHLSVRILGTSSNYAYPVGFGPGCSATFYRILVSSVGKEFAMTPSSYIEIKGTRVASDIQCHMYNNHSGFLDVVPLNNLPSGLISEVMQSNDSKPTRLHSRIVAVLILLMEKNLKATNPQPNCHTRSAVFRIPLAGFVLDDGASSMCCWANNDLAVTFLRLNEKISDEMAKSIGVSKNSKEGGDCNTIIHHVDKIIKKHGCVTVRNYGSIYDSTAQDLSFSVTSGTVFNSSDEEFLKRVVLNACFSPSWTVVGSLMESNAVDKLKKQLAEMDMKMQPMQNIWVREVLYTNPLAEARKVMQDLMS